MWRWRHPPCYWPWTQPPSLPPTHLGYTRVGVGLPTLHPLHPQTLKVEPNEVKERSGSTQEEYSSNWDPTMIKPRRYTLIDGFDTWFMACQHRTINIALQLGLRANYFLILLSMYCVPTIALFYRCPNQGGGAFHYSDKANRAGEQMFNIIIGKQKMSGWPGHTRHL